jgi:branched-chain amino acid transport system permease protein
VLSEFYLGLVALGLAYGLFAFGLDLVWGRAGIVSIGHAVFFGAGAYGVAIAKVHAAPLVLGGAAGIAGAAALALAIGGAGLRRKATPSTMAVLTLGVTLLGAQVATAWVGVTGGTNGLLVLTGLSGAATMWCCLAVAAAVVALCQVLVFRAPLGNRLTALRLNPQRARHLGIDTQRLGLLALAMGAAIAALAGAVAAPLVGLISPEVVGILLSTQVLIWVALGGRNTLLGPFAGAMLATLGQNLLTDVSLSYYLLLLGALFVVVVIVAPDGLVGWLRRPVEVRPAWRPLRRSAAWVTAPPDGSTTPPPPAARQGQAVAVSGVVKRYGGTPAVDGVSIAVAAGEIVCLVGPNGAGKTTLLDVISGDLEADEGRVVVLGHDVSRAPVHRRARLGLARTFQTPSLFGTLTVGEHLTLARQQARGTQQLPESYRRLEDSLSGVAAERLSLGDRRSLEIAVALAGGPRLLLLDEPAAGLSPDEAHELARALLAVRDQLGCAMLAVEHDMEIVRMLADRVVVLHQGAVLRQGSFEEVHVDGRVRDAYLGVT